MESDEELRLARDRVELDCERDLAAFVAPLRAIRTSHINASRAVSANPARIESDHAQVPREKTQICDDQGANSVDAPDTERKRMTCVNMALDDHGNLAVEHGDAAPPLVSRSFEIVAIEQSSSRPPLLARW